MIDRPGYEALWSDFGMSRASFLVMPRAFMHEMPDEWQQRMADLLAEWHATWDWPDEVGVPIVQNQVNGKFRKFPEYVLNYRHPLRDAIDACRAKESGK